MFRPFWGCAWSRRSMVHGGTPAASLPESPGLDHMFWCVCGVGCVCPSSPSTMCMSHLVPSNPVFATVVHLYESMNSTDLELSPLYGFLNTCCGILVYQTHVLEQT